MKTQYYKEKLLKLRGRIDTLEEQTFISRVNIRKLKNKIKIAEEAQLIIQEVARKTQKQIEYHISEITSLSLATVFDKPYNFICRFKDFGSKKTHCDFLFERDGYEVKPQNASGGGACNVAALGLRCTIFNLNNPKTRSILFIEEPFIELKGKKANLRALKLLNKLSNTLGIQFIIISDERVSKKIIKKYADKVFKTSLNNGVTEIEEIK